MCRTSRCVVECKRILANFAHNMRCGNGGPRAHRSGLWAAPKPRPGSSCNGPPPGAACNPPPRLPQYRLRRLARARPPEHAGGLVGADLPDGHTAGATSGEEVARRGGRQGLDVAARSLDRAHLEARARAKTQARDDGAPNNAAERNRAGIHCALSRTPAPISSPRTPGTLSSDEEAGQRVDFYDEIWPIPGRFGPISIEFASCSAKFGPTSISKSACRLISANFGPFSTNIGRFRRNSTPLWETPTCTPGER